MGYFPNSNWSLVEKGLREDPGQSPGRDYFVQVALFDQSNVTAFGASQTDINFRQLTDYFVAIAAGPSYTQLDRLQCQLMFEPTTFLVNVSLVDNTITVHPQRPAVTDPEPTGYFRWAIQRNFNAISMTLSTIYKSAVGDSLMTNIMNQMMAEARSHDTVTAITDDIFSIYAAATLTDPAAYTYRRVQVTREAVQLGSRGFIVANLMLNIVGAMFVFGLTVGEVMRYQGHASRESAQTAMRFDYTDVASLAVAVAVGMAGQVEERQTATERLARATAIANGGCEKAIGTIGARLKIAGKMDSTSS